MTQSYHLPWHSQTQCNKCYIFFFYLKASLIRHKYKTNTTLSFVFWLRLLYYQTTTFQPDYHPLTKLSPWMPDLSGLSSLNGGHAGCSAMQPHYPRPRLPILGWVSPSRRQTSVVCVSQPQTTHCYTCSVRHLKHSRRKMPGEGQEDTHSGTNSNVS